MSWRSNHRRWWWWWSEEEPRSSTTEVQKAEEWVCCFLLILVCCLFLLCWFAFLFVISTFFLVNLWNLSLRNWISTLIFIEIESLILELLQWNRVQDTQDVSFLSSLEMMLTNEIVWKFVLFWRKKFKRTR